MSFCKSCGKELDVDVKFCANCGAAVETAASAPSAPAVNNTAGVRQTRVKTIIAAVCGILLAIVAIVFVPIFSEASAKAKMEEAPRVLSSFEAALWAAMYDYGVDGNFTANDLVFKPPMESKWFIYEIVNDRQGRPTACHAKSKAPIGKFSGTLITEYNGTQIKEYEAMNDLFRHRVEPASMEEIVDKMIPGFITEYNRAASAQSADTVPAQQDNAGSAKSKFTIISKDYKYKKFGADFDYHLENIGNSNNVYNLINRLIYKNKNFDEYMKYIEQNVQENSDDGEAEGNDFRNRYSIICYSDTYVIFENYYYEYTGGAHGNGGTGYIIIDLIEERILGLNELVNPIPDGILDKLIKSKHEISWYLRDNIWPPDAINFCGENIGLLWNQYSITPYSDGQIEIEISNNVITQYLTDKGKKLKKGGVSF